jgi:hypothetical protein
VASAAGTPTGAVQFKIDGSNIGSPGTLLGGKATSGSISTLSVGPHTVTAIYSGDGNFTGSTSSALSQQVRYAVKVLSTAAKGGGPTIVLQLLDNYNVNVSSAKLAVTAVCIVYTGGPAPTSCGANPVQTIPAKTGGFSFVATYQGMGPASSYPVVTKGLATGAPYYLLVQADGDPILHAVQFTE